MTYYVGEQGFETAAAALDHARVIAHALASRAGDVRDVPVTREDGRTIVVRAAPDGTRGNVRTFTRGRY